MSALARIERGMADRRVATGLAIAIALAGVAIWRWVLALPLLGWDAYPLIAASRIDGVGSVAATFGDELMGGRYPLGHYWRPIVHLSFGFDRALWGIEPRGYHASDLALFAALALALFAFVRALAGRAGAVAGPIAALAFALHPSHVEWLTAPARRADGYALLFTLLALRAQLAAASGRKAWRWGAAIACVLALASKEVGAAAAPLVFVLAVSASREPGLGRRVRDALARAWPSMALAAATFGARSLVLGGLGGGLAPETAGPIGRAGESFARYAPAVLASPLARVHTSQVAAAAVVTGLLAIAAFVAVHRARTHDGPIGPLRATAFLALAFAVLASITALSGVERGWYELAFLWLHASVAGLAIGSGFEALSHGARGAGALAIVAGLAVGMPAPPVLRAPPEIQRAGELTRDFLARFHREVSQAGAGAQVRLDRYPAELRGSTPALDGKPRTVTMLAPPPFGAYSLRAYAELALPQRSIWIFDPRQPDARPEPTDVVVLLAP